DLETFYVYGHDLIAQQRGTATNFYQVDGLGSTRVLTDEDGNVTDTYDYEAFGKLIDSSGESDNHYRFAGEQFDQTLGDYYLRDRFYDQHTGRFLRRDVYEGSVEQPMSLHKYMYVHADPVNGIDPSGFLKTTTEVAVVQKILNTLTAFVATVNTLSNASRQGVLRQMTSQQRDKLFQSYPQAINYIQPEGDPDDQGRRCFVAEVPRYRSTPDAIYEQHVTNSPNQFLGISRNATAIMFDGKEPGTRNVWEAKYGYAHIPDNDFLTTMDMVTFVDERLRGQIVSNDCGYNYQWAFSEVSPYNYVNALWNGSPPAYHIP
ncbi:MAG: RHS repeat-associated core domain-containing protein, partial [Cyanothece sp. SIO2G6]|nr:RHS repeat-associated core domain-containing protein [Cyanothece sp. SIO2G6]